MDVVPPTALHLQTAAPVVPQTLNPAPVEELSNDVHVTVTQHVPGAMQSPPISGVPQFYFIQNQSTLMVTGSKSSSTSNTVVARTLAPKPAPSSSKIISSSYVTRPSPPLKSSHIYPRPSLAQTFKTQSTGTTMHSFAPVITSSASTFTVPRTKTILLQSPRLLGPVGMTSPTRPLGPLGMVSSTGPLGPLSLVSSVASSTPKHTGSYLSQTSLLKPTPGVQLSLANKPAAVPTASKQPASSVLMSRKLPLQVGFGGTGSINLKIANGKIQNEGQTSIKLLQDGAKSAVTLPSILLQGRAPTPVKRQQLQQSFIMEPFTQHAPKTWSQTHKKPLLPFTLPQTSRKPNIIKSKSARLSSTSVADPDRHIKASKTSTKPVQPQSVSASNEQPRDASILTASKEPHGQSSKQDLNRCLQEVVDSLFPRMSPGLSQKPDANEVTLMKVPITGASDDKKAAVLPDDDIHIELVPQKCDSSQHTGDVVLQKPSFDVHKTTDLVPRAPTDELPCANTVPEKSTGESLSSTVTNEKPLNDAVSLDTGVVTKPTEDGHVNQDVEKCSKKPSSANTNETDKTKVLDWEGDLAAIPGIDLKFRLNEFGLMEMVDGNNVKCDNNNEKEKKITDEPNLSFRVEPMEVDPDSTKPLKAKAKEEEVDAKSEPIKKPDEICCCGGCGCYGLQSEFLNTRFCSEACIEEGRYRDEMEVKKSKEQEELSKKRRKVRCQQLIKKEEKRLKAQIQVQNLLDTLENVVSASHSETTDPPQSNPPSISEEDVSNDGSQGSGKPLLAWQKGKNGFLWAKYLEYYKVKPAPAKLFKDSLPFAKNGFKVGMKMEGIDPEHASLFCVLTVANVVGFRLQLHFDGYGDEYDFWVNADSADIFPPGWCEKNGRQLEPPPGFSKSNFQWNPYLKQCRLPAAHKSLFCNKNDASVCPLGFRIGMKLEAVDRQNTSLVCVATVADLLDNRILVHFDGWDDVYDYWADPTSSYIHPVGWCEDNKHMLTPPNDFKGEKFTWEDYLKATKSTAAPSRAFKPRTGGGFRSGMRLECVDRRSPGLIRVASVDDVREHQIRVKFDGWTDIYSYWIDDDSQDIHPMTWCSKAGHTLEPPFTVEDQAADCPTPGCKGQGHVHGSKNMKNHTIPNCPYDPQSLILQVDVPDRLSTKQRQRPSLVEKRPADQKPRPGRPPKLKTISLDGKDPPRNRPGRPPKYRRLEDGQREPTGDANWTADGDENREKRRQRKVQKQAALAKRNYEYDVVRHELHQAVMHPEYEPNPDHKDSCLWAKHSRVLNTYVEAAGTEDFTGWDPDKVSGFVASIPGCQTVGDVFKKNHIDGEGFGMMSQNDFVTHMGLKLGPAIKLYNSIVLLRQKMVETKT